MSNSIGRLKRSTLRSIRLVGGLRSSLGLFVNNVQYVYDDWHTQSPTMNPMASGEGSVNYSEGRYPRNAVNFFAKPGGDDTLKLDVKDILSVGIEK